MHQLDSTNPDLSVVIPVFNEEAMLPELFRRLDACMTEWALTCEIILVNDGSVDQTAGMLDARAAIDARYRALHFSRNFGHQAAVTAGLDHTRGATVVVLDADLQDPPELIPQMRQHWRDGHDVVFGVRQKRKETLWKRLAYHSYYRLLRWSTPVALPLDAGDFALMDEKVVRALRQMPERNRYVRGIRAWVGFRQIGMPYERDRRYAGEVKYNLAKLVKLAIDGLLSFSTLPLRLGIYLGLGVSATSFLLAVCFIVLKLTWGIEIQGWASTAVMILFMGGVQLLTIGVIGEYVSRIYDEVKQRPIYVVARRKGFSDDD